MATASRDYDATKSPGLDLYTHILHKGFQLGSVLGVGVIAPARAAYTAVWLKQPVAPPLLIKTAGTTTLSAFVLVGEFAVSKDLTEAGCFMHRADCVGRSTNSSASSYVVYCSSSKESITSATRTLPCSCCMSLHECV
jgi:hypothetical protein